MKLFINFHSPSWLALRIVLLSMAAGGIHAQTAPGAWTLVWSDEFDGETLNAANWGYWNGQRRNAVNVSEAVMVSGGALKIATYTEGGTHYTGIITSANKVTSAYGYIEARIDFNSSPGMWSAFWMLSNNMGNPVGDPWTAGTEIDIIEHRKVNGSGSNIENNAAQTIHWDGYGNDHKSTTKNTSNTGIAGGYHLYGLEWTPVQQRFYIDGVLTWTVNNASGSPVSQTSEYLVLSSEVQNANWAGNIPAGGYGTRAASTTNMLVDYIRIYRRSETLENANWNARLAPWTTSGSALWSGSAGQSGGGAELTPAPGSAAEVLQQAVGLLPATDYVLAGSGRVAAASQTMELGVRNHGGSEVIQALGGTAWSGASRPFRTGATSRTATVFARAAVPGIAAYADDFSLRRAAAIDNGHFEGMTLESWSGYGSTIAPVPARDGNTAGGPWSLQMPSGSWDQGIEQRLAGLKPGTTYRFSAWTRTSGQPVYLGAKDAGAANASTILSNANWARGSLQFATGPSNTTATVVIWRPNSTGVAYADAALLTQDLLAPWTGADLGTPAFTGLGGMLEDSAGQRFILQTSGDDFWNTTDSGHFVSQPVTGDFMIDARLIDWPWLRDNSKAGVMIRATGAANAAHATTLWMPGGNLCFLRRPSTGAATTATLVPHANGPVWLRLVRRGNLFTSFGSVDGQLWTMLGSPQNIVMPSPVRIGLAATTSDNSQLAEAIFDSVSVRPPDVDASHFADWQRQHWPGEQTDPPEPGPSLLANSALADPDGDGIENLLEWALGTDPRAGQVMPLQTGRMEAGGQEYLTLTVRRPVGRVGASYAVEASGDLIQWTPGVSVGTPVANGDGSETIVFRDVVPANERVRFLRLHVERE